MKPLLFMPSPRNIIEVQKHWHTLPADKFIVKYEKQLVAYHIAKEFFQAHKEYTHIGICPDDLVITKNDFDMLVEDVKVHDFPVVSGICGLDEKHPNIWSIQKKIRLDREVPDAYSWINDEYLPDERFYQVGHSGFCFEIVEREVFEKVSWIGSTNHGQGSFDWQFSKDCHTLGIPIIVDTEIKLKHLRNEQSVHTPFFRNSGGYSFLLKE